MPFSVGDTVHLPGIGTGIVRALRRGGRATVEIKGLNVEVNAQQLEPAEPSRKARATSTSADTSHTACEFASLDLHGYTVEEAVAALDTFINDALLASATEVRVIHGRSGGRIKHAVHARLRELPPVRAFRLDPRNPGVTIVSL